MGFLSQKEIDQYHEDGVVFLRGFLTPAEARSANEELDRYIDEVVPRLPEGERVYEGEASHLRNLFHMDVHDEFFSKFGHQEKLRDIVEELQGWRYQLHYVESFLKPAHCGSEVPVHQDEPFLNLMRPHFVTAWFPLDPVDEGNGTLRFILGSHKWGAMPHDLGTLPGSPYITSNAEALKAMPNVPAVLEPGDVAFFSCRLLHYSLPNRSERRRRILGVGMRGPDAGFKMPEENSASIVNSLRLNELG
jgi:phytanoyl-CoA hydroxylase